MTLTAYFDRYCTQYAPYKGGDWCYEDGCIYRGLHLLAVATGDPRWRGHLHRLVDVQIAADGSLRGYSPEAFNIDNILPGRVLISLAQGGGDPRYLRAAQHLLGQLDRHPRIPAGNYWHKLRYPHQLWLDGLYMALPFQIEYALHSGETAPIADALAQFDSALRLTEVPGGLHCHGYDDSRAQRWSDPATGRSAAVWARAMGWLAMALVDALALLPEDATTRPLRARLSGLLTAVAARQSASGLWYQVLDAQDLPGNYLESSASAMFAYAFLRASRFGLAPDLRDAGLHALAALAALTAQTGAQGLGGICEVAGLGTVGGPYRDGSPGYYLTERVVTDDAKGVGPLMMAWAEAQYAP